MSACPPPRSGWLLPAALLLAGFVAGPHALRAQTPDAAPRTLGHPGYLVVVGAAAPDTASGFLWQTGPGEDQRSLVWDEGMLTIPADLQPETFGPEDLAVPCGAGLTGTGNTGRLVFRPGRYPVTEPLLLTDGVVTLYVAGGELEIVGERVRYRATGSDKTDRKDPRASFMLLAGLVLLTVVLLRRARRGLSGGPGR